MIRFVALGLLAALPLHPVNAFADMQAEGTEQAGRERGEVIDILVPVLTPEEQAERDACEKASAEAAAKGEILVCAQPTDSSEFFYSGNAEAAENRYARETMNKGNPQTPDPCGEMCGIFTGPPTLSGLCGFLFNPCPPPQALIVDVGALPQAPEGSDADRVAQGLAPLGEDEEGDSRPMSEFERRELGLPPVPDFDERGDPEGPATDGD